MERYAAILGNEFGSFTEALERPLPLIAWANPLRPGLPLSWLEERGVSGTPLSWAESVWRLPPKTPVGTWPEYRLGWVHVQEEVTLWPADALGAQPGERILDLCAAPGNKTARIAANMKNTGFLHANEKRWQRASALRFNLDRLGVTCAGVTLGDGREMGWEGPLFDRALLDVPCSGEGMVRKTKGFVRPTSSQEREGMVGTQKGLLRSATEALRPGGILVYATCTFAPEENENVVDWGIRNLPLELLDLEAPAEWSPRPGLPVWNGIEFHPSIAKCGRFWPHIHDSGGFFIAKLRKV